MVKKTNQLKTKKNKDFLKCVSTRNNDTKLRLIESVLNGIAVVIPEKINFPSFHWEDETRRSHTWRSLPWLIA